MSERILGIHHVTAITGDAQRNVDFYTGVLGLRLVKVTVNYDDPGSYHLYYGDDLGRPGTGLTFFAWPGAATLPRERRRGTRLATATAYAVPTGALDFWRDRLGAADVPSEDGEIFGESECLKVRSSRTMVVPQDARSTRHQRQRAGAHVFLECSIPSDFFHPVARLARG